MALYKFTLPDGAKTLKYDGVTDAFVQAGSQAAALVLLKAVSSKDNDVVWDNATATLVGQDLEGITFRVVVDAPVLDVSYTAVADDEWTDVGTALAALLVAAGMNATWTPEATHGLYGTLKIANGDANAAVTAVAIVAGGTGYTDADTLTVSGGTSATAATITATTTVGGVITVATLAGAGDYSVLPSNPVAVTGGTGNNDATFNLTWNAEQPGAGAVTVTVVDAASNDLAAASVGNIVDEGVATADLSVDILSTVPSTKVIGLFVG
jgi:hypothetical protein